MWFEAETTGPRGLHRSAAGAGAVIGGGKKSCKKFERLYYTIDLL